MERVERNEWNKLASNFKLTLLTPSVKLLSAFLPQTWKLGFHFHLAVKPPSGKPLSGTKRRELGSEASKWVLLLGGRTAK